MQCPRVPQLGGGLQATFVRARAYEADVTSGFQMLEQCDERVLWEWVSSSPCPHGLRSSLPRILCANTPCIYANNISLSEYTARPLLLSVSTLIVTCRRRRGPFETRNARHETQASRAARDARRGAAGWRLCARVPRHGGARCARRETAKKVFLGASSTSLEKIAPPQKTHLFAVPSFEMAFKLLAVAAILAAAQAVTEEVRRTSEGGGVVTCPHEGASRGPSSPTFLLRFPC